MSSWARRSTDEACPVYLSTDMAGRQGSHWISSWNSSPSTLLGIRMTSTWRRWGWNITIWQKTMSKGQKNCLMLIVPCHIFLISSTLLGHVDFPYWQKIWRGVIYFFLTVCWDFPPFLGEEIWEDGFLYIALQKFDHQKTIQKHHKLLCDTFTTIIQIAK